MQKKLRMALLLPTLLLLTAGAAYGHGVQVPIIVDTDAAADDIRALAMLVNSGKDAIRLIVTSDGVLSPGEGKQAVLKTLNVLGAEDIPVAAGRETAVDAPPFRNISRSLKWPSAKPVKPASPPEAGAAAAVARTLSSTDTRAIYLCLGPLTNLADALAEDPGLAGGILRLVYLGGAPGSENSGWNTERDPDAAARVFGAGIPIDALCLPDDRYLFFDSAIYGAICAEKGRAAQLICETHSASAVQAHLKKHRMRIWDEIAVVCLNRPEAFTFQKDPRFSECRRLADFDAAAVRQTYLQLVGNPADYHLDARSSVVLKAFPADPALFRPDVAPEVEAIIAAHGEEEWKACLLTNELHRHLGVYSLVGAKMGIRAREMLGAPFDTLEVISYAGSEPPVSCLNDGLQVSTGASLGRGTITVAQPEKARPAATFLYGDTALTLALKPAVVEKIKADIRSALTRFGTTGPAYFAQVRQLSMRYWLELDRNRIFDCKWQLQKADSPTK